MEKKILYFDCASGISGNMTLGALLDLGLDEQAFRDELKKLPVNGYEIIIRETRKNGIRAKHLEVLLEEEECGHDHGHQHGHCHDHNHPHSHGHFHRSFGDIRRMILDSTLEPEVKELALRIFERVAKAEAKVHAKPVEEVHFHEVGAVDSIVDIVGCAILICQLKPDEIWASTVHEGHGFVHCQHGMLPVPVPATGEIFAASEAVLRQIDVEGEMVTPTGAAIVCELAQYFGTMPEMKIDRIGWGAGTKDFPIPNVLKAYWGKSVEMEKSLKEKATLDLQEQASDEIMVLETNLDDCTGELLGYAMEKLMEAGALDVSYQPVFMKKNRPAYRLTVLAKPEDTGRLEKLIFLYTTTIGIRKRREERTILKREEVTIDTPWGGCLGKKVILDGQIRVYPEYESAAGLARKHGISLWEIMENYGESR